MSYYHHQQGSGNNGAYSRPVAATPPPTAPRRTGTPGQSILVSFQLIMRRNPARRSIRVRMQFGFAGSELRCMGRRLTPFDGCAYQKGIYTDSPCPSSAPSLPPRPNDRRHDHSACPPPPWRTNLLATPNHYRKHSTLLDNDDPLRRLRTHRNRWKRLGTLPHVVPPLAFLRHPTTLRHARNNGFLTNIAVSLNRPIRHCHNSIAPVTSSTPPLVAACTAVETATARVTRLRRMAMRTAATEARPITRTP